MAHNDDTATDVSKSLMKVSSAVIMICDLYFSFLVNKNGMQLVFYVFCDDGKNYDTKTRCFVLLDISLYHDVSVFILGVCRSDFVMNETTRGFSKWIRKRSATRTVGLDDGPFVNLLLQSPT